MRREDWLQRLAGWLPSGAAADFDRWRRAGAAATERWRRYLEEIPEPDQTRWPGSWLRPKGNLSRGGLLLLLLIALLPLLSMVVRISAWPGVLGPGTGGTMLSSLAYDLNHWLSLRDISAEDREHVLYVLFVPTAAVLIAFARLALGIRVIGFRAILIAVGFQHSGIVPSVLLILVMVFVVASIRPVLVRMRLTYFPRIAVIMSVSVLVLVGALMVAPWVRSDALWSMAFFPVIVLGLMAEGIAKTIDRDSTLTAFWRTGMTIVIALGLAGLSLIPVLREFALEFPELVVTQIVLIVLIAEFLDLRLLQDWDAKLSEVAPPRLFPRGPALRIAVVRNRHRNGVIGQLGAPGQGGYRRRTVKHIVACLRQKGHTVNVLEGDMSLLANLRSFMPPNLLNGEPGGIVLNLAHGIQGEVAAAHVPAMLELAGLAYTGATPLGFTSTQDRLLAHALLRQHGLATPEYSLLCAPGSGLRSLQYPVVVRPRTATGRRPRVASNRQQLIEAVAQIAHRDGVASVVEPFVAGREIEVAVLGNQPARCMPLVEVLPGRAGRVCPAVLDAPLAAAVRSAALAAFRACNCRDYAVVQLRLPQAGAPVIVGLETTAVLEPGATFEVAAATAGLAFADLVELIVGIARERYRPEPGAAGTAVGPVSATPGDGSGGELVAG